MKDIAAQLETIINTETKRLKTLTDADWNYSYAPGKWTKKEILGHLVDSALNNIQRFIRVQHQEMPHIVYYQDDWVRIAAYKEYSTTGIVQLWETLNRYICHVLANADAAYAEKQINTGKNGPELHTFRFIAEDYVTHLVGHMKQL